jgi:hypothetical protein
MKRQTLIALVLVAVVTPSVLIWRQYAAPSAGPVTPPAFEGDSKDLKETIVVPTLDAPIPAGKNVIWCASFVSAWKKIEADITSGPLVLEGNPPIADSLNKAPDPRPDIPPSSLYVAAGWNSDGILQTIASDLKKQFPGKTPPSFPGLDPDAFVAYSYLEARIAFDIPYSQNDKPLVFTDRAGRETEVSSFGIRPQDRSGNSKIRRNPRVLYTAQKDDYYQPIEWIMDLDRSSTPNQIILALIEPKFTLEETVADAEKKIADYPPDTRREGYLENNDTLLVPDIVWNIAHHFSELEGRRFQNGQLKKQPIEVAEQDIAFSLNRNGVELRSEARIVTESAPIDYVFNHPFLLYMKKRGAAQPYFAMWVENAELLAKWKPEAGNEASSHSK